MPENNNEKRVTDTLDCMEKRIKEVSDYAKQLINHFKWSITTFLAIVTILIAVLSFGTYVYVKERIIEKIDTIITEDKVSEVIRNQTKEIIESKVTEELVVITDDAGDMREQMAEELEIRLGESVAIMLKDLEEQINRMTDYKIQQVIEEVLVKPPVKTP